MRIHSPQITGSAANTNIILTTVTSSISVLSASFASTASYWSGSIINAASASYWSGSIINAATASYILNAVSASYVLNAISSSFAETASSADNLTVRGTLTAQTINVQTITSSIDYVTGSSINGSLLSNTHQITGSTSITGSLTVNDSNVILTNQTSSMSVATASYWSGSIINAATASYVQNAISASYALTASYAANVPETASYALQANSASFALTASYISGSGAGVGFPFSGSAIITGSLFVSGSTISGSFKGDGSQITGLTAGGKIHTQSSAASTWTVSHNLGVQYPNVTVYNASNEVIIPQTITATDTNTLTLTFGSAVSGYAVSGIGGIINVQGRTTQQYFAAATTWSFAHNLGDRYVSLQAFDDAFEMMIPTTIRLVDATSSIMLFESASSGYAVATIGGDLPAISSSYAGYTLQVANSAPYSASWVAAANVTVTNAVSSSFAATASSADNLTVRGTLTAQTINVQTITSSIDFVTGSTRNGSIAGNIHEFTGSVSITGSATTLLSVNNSVLFVSSSGNVGIGTTSPGSKLAINAGASGGLRIDTNSTYNAISIGGTGIFSIDAPGVSGGRLIVLDNGNTGIGTASPSTKLHVYEPLTNTTAYLTIQNNRARNAAVYTQTTNGGFYAGTSIGTDTFNYQIYDAVAGAARLTISSTGAATFASTVTAGGQLITSAGQTGGYVAASSGYVNETQTVSTNGTSYYLYKSTGTANGSSSTIFNITGMSTSNGTFADIYAVAQKDATASGINTNLEVQINGQYMVGIQAGGTSATTVRNSFRVCRMDGSWIIIGTVRSF